MDSDNNQTVQQNIKDDQNNNHATGLVDNSKAPEHTDQSTNNIKPESLDKKTEEYEKQLKIVNNIQAAKNLEELKSCIKEAIDMGLANNQLLIERANKKKNELMTEATNNQQVEEEPASKEDPKPAQEDEEIMLKVNTADNSPADKEESPSLDEALNKSQELNQEAIPADQVEAVSLIQNTEIPKVELNFDNSAGNDEDQGGATMPGDNQDYNAASTIEPNIEIANEPKTPEFTPAEEAHHFNTPQNFLETQADEMIKIPEAEQVKIQALDPVLAHEKDLLKEFNELMGELVVLASEANMLTPEDKSVAKNIADTLTSSWNNICQKRGKSLDDSDSKYILEIIDQQLKKLG
jgi:hypothetical protein